MSVSGIGSQSSLVIQSLVDMRHRLDDLQRQLSSGQKADTYAGMGIARGFAVGLRAQVSALASFDDTINNVSVRVALAQTALGRMSEIGHEIKAATLQTQAATDPRGHTISQAAAASAMDELLGLLNTRAGDRYLFSGRDPGQPAVEPLDHIMNGDGGRAGLKQIIAERRQADLGADGLGRLTITSPTTTSILAPRKFWLSKAVRWIAGMTSSVSRR